MALLAHAPGCHHPPGRNGSRAIFAKVHPRMYAFTLLDFLIFLVAWAAAVCWALFAYWRLADMPKLRDHAQEWAEYERLHGRAPKGPVVYGVLDHKGNVNPAAKWRDSE
jgi:hypothetical protein